MTSDIKPGDLVMVVRPMRCCGAQTGLGSFGIVEGAPVGAYGIQCDSCGDADLDIANIFTIRGNAISRYRLKKIDPPALADEVERVRELEAV